MGSQHTRFPWLGIVLIIFGAVLLLRKFHVVDIEFFQVIWPLIMLLGLTSVAKGFTKNKRGKIFSGTILFLYGLFFFMRTIDSFILPWYLIFPTTFVIFGMGFFMMYLQNIRDWYLCVLALFLLGIGGAFFLTEYGYLYGWEVLETIHLYWPIVLILIGIGIIFRRKSDVHATQAL